jgi:hypothetical protein
MITTQRPTFIYRDTEIRAGGILFYRFTNKGQVEVLLSNKNNRYEDLGGKTDSIDKTIFDTISREVQEETNGLFNSKVVSSQLYNNKENGIVNGKYLLFAIKANSYERKCHSEEFGDHETLYDIPRTMHWVSLSCLSHIHLHPRLSVKQIFNLPF